MTSVPRNPAGGSGPERPESGWGAGAEPLDPDDPLLLERLGLVLPDDARELDGDRRALFGPRRRFPRFGGRGHDRLTRPHPQLMALLVTFSLLAATIVLTSALIGVMSTRTDVTAPSAFALAAKPAATPGVVGGLLPDVGATLDDAVGVSAQNLRPAVLFVPPGTSADGSTCATCADAVENLSRQAREYGLRVYVVAPPESAAAAREIAAGANASTHLLLDASGALTAAYSGASARAVLVHADGVVGRVLSDPSPTARYEQLLSPLRQPGGPPSLRPAATMH